MIAALASLLFVETWSFTQLAIAVVVIIGVIAVLLVVVRVAEVPVPPWFWHALASIAGIVILCFLAILAIRLLASM